MAAGGRRLPCCRGAAAAHASCGDQWSAGWQRAGQLPLVAAVIYEPVQPSVSGLPGRGGAGRLPPSRPPVSRRPGDHDVLSTGEERLRSARLSLAEMHFYQVADFGHGLSLWSPGLVLATFTDRLMYRTCIYTLSVLAGGVSCIRHVPT